MTPRFHVAQLDAVAFLRSLPAASVLERAVPEPMSGCWLWAGSTNANGYGSVRQGKFTMLAHRWAWWVTHGVAPPPHLCVCHRCDVRCCVNPDHLFLGTHLDNTRDMEAKGRGRKLCGDLHPARLHPENLSRGDDHWTRREPGRLAGEHNGRARLTWEQVVLIRERFAAGATKRGLGREYGVHSRTIDGIVKGQTWPRGAQPSLLLEAAP